MVRRLLIDGGGMVNILLVEAGKAAILVIIIRVWRKGNSWSVMMEQLPEVNWKIESVFNELMNLAKEISRRSVENICRMHLVTCAKELQKRDESA